MRYVRTVLVYIPFLKIDEVVQALCNLFYNSLGRILFYNSLGRFLFYNSLGRFIFYNSLGRFPPK